jgi:hypothetical protein
MTPPSIPLEQQIAQIEAVIAHYGKYENLNPNWHSILASLKELQASRWISVKDEFPEDGAEVLVYHVLGDRAVCNKACDVAAYVNGKWIFPWDRGNLNNPPQWVTHWKPISPPIADKGTK